MKCSHCKTTMNLIHKDIAKRSTQEQFQCPLCGANHLHSESEYLLPFSEELQICMSQEMELTA